MATAMSSATMAAAGFDKSKRISTSSSLQTPGSGTFPSELLSPITGSPSFMKKDDALKTPITPPSAYLDFLRNITPAIQSPASTTSARFSFHEKSFDRSSDKTSDYSGPKSSISPPTSQPPLSRNHSSDSNTTDKSVTASSSAGGESSTRPESPRIIIPPSSFAKPAPRSARTPRRLNIPQSPFSPAIGSAQSVPSPYSSTPLSAAPWSASFSPRENNTEMINQPGKVHVRHVVTRTVTYCRTPLDPAPKGKRRKIEMDEDDGTSSTTSKASSEEPPLKQERIEKINEESTMAAESASASASEEV